jgi:hypothetical protein
MGKSLTFFYSAPFSLALQVADGKLFEKGLARIMGIGF